jgi:hypothetical protein
VRQYNTPKRSATAARRYGNGLFDGLRSADADDGSVFVTASRSVHEYRFGAAPGRSRSIASPSLPHISSASSTQERPIGDSRAMGRYRAVWDTVL